MSLSRPTALVAMLALDFTSVLATAQTPGVRHESARQIVAEKLGADFTQKQVAALNVVAHSTAASIICDRIDLNEAAVRSRLERVIAEAAPSARNQIARNALRDRMLVGFGALLGLMLQDAAPNSPRFCNAAEADMKKQRTESLLKLHVVSR